MPPPKRTTKDTQPTRSNNAAGYPKELNGEPLERQKRELKKVNEPVDLRIYYCRMKRADSKPSYSSNENLYVGYVAAEGVVTDPVDAAVAVYANGRNDRTLVPLTTQSGFADLKQSVEMFLPEGYELYPNAAFRVPRRQWRRGDRRSYCSEERVTKKEKEPFREIESDGQFLAALANYSAEHKTPAIARAGLEAKAKVDTPVLSSSDDDSPRSSSRSREVSYRVLEILVGVRSAANGSKKSGKASSAATLKNMKIEVEIGAPVIKGDDGSLQVADRRCLNETREKLIIDLGTDDGSCSQTPVGQVRFDIKNYAKKLVREYALMSEHTALYHVPKLNSNSCVMIERTSDLYKWFRKASRESDDKEDNATIKCMRFAFVAVAKKDAGRADLWEVQEPPADANDPLLLSQPEVVASPPGAQVAAAAKRSASRSVVVDTKELIKTLYTDPTSPVYHGLTYEMTTNLEQLLHHSVVRKEYSLEREDGSDFPLEKLTNYFRNNPKIAKVCCNLLPEREAYPPEANGDPPASRKFAKADADGSLEGLVSSVAVAINKIAESKTADAVAHAGPGPQ
jgi:hypothetical protein